MIQNDRKSPMLRPEQVESNKKQTGGILWKKLK